jgi:predicted RNA-binding Zn ribbon-like protein
MLDRQPGHRPPAPGQLALVQAFLNTHFDLGERWGGEALFSPAALRAWLEEHGLAQAAAPDDLPRALALRRHLRAAIQAPSDPEALARLSAPVAGAPATVSFSAHGPRFGAGPGVGGGLGALAAIAAGAMLDGSWSRLKLCPGEHCGWAFYDQSRNRSGRWCSMSVCGARTKARAHYARTRGRA